MAKVSEMPQIMAPVVRFRMPSYSERETGHGTTPNQWFADKFPEAARNYGPAFMEATTPDMDGLPRSIPAYLNDDFFAAILGGDPRLGHQVVYFAPEETFYFFDLVTDAFCPTSVEKLIILLSNCLIRCSQECGATTEITNLVTSFRKPEILAKIVTKAKAMLEADRHFFEGASGKRRMVDGKIVDPNEEPAYKVFVKKGIVRNPEAKLTVPDAFHHYFRFCKEQGVSPLTRQEFKSLVAEVIREEFRICLRHDIPTDSGKQGHGWIGIDCRMDFVESMGRN